MNKESAWTGFGRLLEDCLAILGQSSLYYEISHSVNYNGNKKCVTRENKC